MIKQSGPNYKIIYDNNSTCFPFNQIRQWYESKNLLIGHHHKITIPKPKLSEMAPPYCTPKIRVVDTAPTSSTNSITLNVDLLVCKNFGFRNIDSILKEIQLTSTNIKISTKEREPILDIGETVLQLRDANMHCSS